MASEIVLVITISEHTENPVHSGSFPLVKLKEDNYRSRQNKKPGMVEH
jgi:hypothetical protein